MNHFIHIIKDIGLHMNEFESFISDTKSIVTGTYTILFMIAFIIDITINGGEKHHDLVINVSHRYF